MSETRTRSEQKEFTEDRMKRFEEARDSLNDLFWGAHDDQRKQVIYNLTRAYPMMPKSPADFGDLIELAMDSAVYWMLGDNVVTLNDEYRATEEEVAEKRAKRAASVEGSETTGNVVELRKPGAYL